MEREKGKFKEGNPGKPKGAVNKTTKLVKEVFADVFDKMQTDQDARAKKADLESWAKENPTEFYKLASKLIPVQIAGDADNPVPISLTDGLSFEQLMKLKYGPDWKA